MPETDRTVKTSRRYRRFSFVVAVLLLALQAIAVICPPTESDALQSKTPSINPPPKGFQWFAAQETTGLSNNDVYEVGFVGGAVLRGTGGHPLWSLDRDDWVSVRDLQVGERLQAAEGAVSVEALEKVRGLHRVYNLEVEGDHEYLVCVQQRLAYPAEEGSVGVKARNPVARWQVGEKSKAWSPLTRSSYRMAANHRAITK